MTMVKPKEHFYYQSYVLRCWCDDEAASQPTWRFSLENTRTGQRRGFANLEVLLIALQTELRRDGLMDETD